ncbi:MAG: PAS domain S-box protein [Syntrophobacteraceae bacterium]
MTSRPYRFGYIPSLVIIPFFTLAAMSAFQLLKHIFWPNITIWASHIDTAIFISAVAAVGGFFACRYLEARSLLAYVVESSDDSIIAVTLDGIVLTWNGGAENIFGYHAGEVVGKPVSILLPSDLPGDVSNILDRIRRGEQVEHYQTTRISKDGKKVHISLTVSPILDATGRIIGASSIARDITERKEREEEIKQTNAYLENVLENSPEAIGIVDEHGKFIKWNKMAAELYGYSLEELRGKSGFGLYSDRDELEIMLKDLRRQGSVKKREMLMKRKDGSTAPFEISVGLLQDREGKVLGSVSVGRDLSEIKKALIELKASNEEVQRLNRRNQLILDAAGEGVVGVDLAGKVTFINPAGAGLAGYQVEELIQKDFHQVVHHSRADGAPYPVDECPMFESLSIGVARRERNEVFWRKDGTSFSVAYSSTPILEEGQILGAVITFRDITLRKLALEELNKYRDHLEDLVKERTTELAMANEQLTREIEERERTEAELHRAHDELELRVKERTASLEKANAELRQIPSRLISVQEEERKRLASELHDSIGQTLAALKLWVEMVLRLRDEGNDSAAFDRLGQFVPILQRSIEETRNIYMGLRPPMLDNMGLLATLEWLRRENMRLYPDHHIELEVGIAEEKIPESLKASIFRVAQEALNNIAKHSKAEWVDISLSKNGSGIELIVSDDGVGMDLDLTLRTSPAKSLGLTSMRERAELTGGSFSIESTPVKVRPFGLAGQLKLRINSRKMESLNKPHIFRAIDAPPNAL